MIYMCADLHIGRKWKGYRQMENDSLIAMERMIDVIVEHDAGSESKHLIIAGDIFDTRKVYGDALDSMSWAIMRCENYDISVHFITGNHDINNIPHTEVVGAVDLAGRVGDKTFSDRLSPPKEYKIDGKTVVGIQWCPRNELHERINTIERPCELLVLHCAFEHVLSFEGAFDLSISQVPDAVQNVLAGDVHVRNVTLLMHGEGSFLSPGSLHPTKIDEGNEHGVWAWSADSQDVADATFLQVPTRQIFRFRIDDEAGIEPTLNEINERIPKKPKKLNPVIEVKYSALLSDKVLPPLELLVDRCVLITHPVGGKLIEFDDGIEDDALTMTLEDALPLALSPEENPAVPDLISNMLAGDPDRVVQELVEELA